MRRETDYDGFTLTREQAREIDRLAMEEYGVRGLILMENAGRKCASVAVEMLEDVDNPEVAIFCGGGNNGGDGFVLARHLWNWGYAVKLYLVGHLEDVLSKDTDAAVNLEIACNMGIPITEIDSEEQVQSVAAGVAEVDLVVDALLGTGISGEVRGLFRPLIQALNDLPVRKMAVDMPSGLDCDTGEVLGVACEAEHTVTFVLRKRGQSRSGAERYTGRVHVAEISVPRELLERKIGEWREGR